MTSIGFFDIILISLGLAMDAVAVGMADGMASRPNWKQMLTIAFFFGVFQGLMPLAGFFAGSLFAGFIGKTAHWLALVLLCFIGTKMILDTRKKEDALPSLSLKILLVQSVGVSIDALAVGVSFVGISLNIFLVVSIIAGTTAALTFLAVFVGKKCGNLFSTQSKIVGGIILIAIGFKIFVEAMWF